MFEQSPLTIPLAYILTVGMCLAMALTLLVKNYFHGAAKSRPTLLVHYALFLVMMLFDLAWAMSEYRGFQRAWFSMLSNGIWYFILLTCSVYYSLVVPRKDLDIRFPGTTWGMVLYLTPLATAYLVLFCSPWTRWALDVSPSGTYLRGPYVPWLYGVVLFYGLSSMIVCLWTGLRAEDVLGRRTAFSMMLIPVPYLVGGILQLQTGFAFLVMGIIFSLALYDLGVQRRDILLFARERRAKNEFFSMVSHDIRTPLNAILGFSQLLQSAEGSPAERRQMLKSIATSSQTLLELVNDVLDLSKLEEGKMEIHCEPTDLNQTVDAVRNVFTEAGRAKGLVLVVDVSMVPPLLLDAQRIRQILFNLFGNALKFTERGSISVAARWEPVGGVNGERGRLSLSVSDTGCGIAPKDQNRLMEAFEQADAGRRHGGTGLGLAICRKLADLMGGTFTLQSELGKGSTFTLILPDVLRAEKKDAPARPAKQADTPRTNLHILVVDDSPMNLRVMVAMLQRLGCRDVETAPDGRDALWKLDMSVRSPEARPFDLVLTDIQMKEMDGDELVKEIRANSRLKHLPVYAVTAEVEARLHEADVGFNDILLKPVTLEKLQGIFGKND